MAGRGNKFAKIKYEERVRDEINLALRREFADPRLMNVSVTHVELKIIPTRKCTGILLMLRPGEMLKKLLKARPAVCALFSLPKWKSGILLKYTTFIIHSLKMSQKSPNY